MAAIGIVKWWTSFKSITTTSPGVTRIFWIFTLVVIQVRMYSQLGDRSPVNPGYRRPSRLAYQIGLLKQLKGWSVRAGYVGQTSCTHAGYLTLYLRVKHANVAPVFWCKHDQIWTFKARLPVPKIPLHRTVDFVKYWRYYSTENVHYYSAGIELERTVKPHLQKSHQKPPRILIFYPCPAHFVWYHIAVCLRNPKLGHIFASVSTIWNPFYDTWVLHWETQTSYGINFSQIHAILFVVYIIIIIIIIITTTLKTKGGFWKNTSESSFLRDSSFVDVF